MNDLRLRLQGPGDGQGKDGLPNTQGLEWRRREGLARRLFPHSRRCSYLGTWQVASRSSGTSNFGGPAFRKEH
jgi:hypothetical protein